MSASLSLRAPMPHLVSRARLPIASRLRWPHIRSERGATCQGARGLATVQVAAPAQAMHSPLPLDSKVPQRARSAGELWLHDKAHDYGFYQSIAKIMQWRDRYVEDRTIFVRHDEMVDLMRGLGAREEDFGRLQVVSNNLQTDPTLPFRKSRTGRFCMDYDRQSLRRLEFQPFSLSAAEDFKRHDSDTVRVFDEIEEELHSNTVLQGLMIFKAMVMHGVPTMHRPNFDYGANKWVCTMFNLRTVTRPDILGEPALEGVHTDGVDHTMTTYLGSSNMKPNSAVTLLHERDETTGTPFHETSPNKIYGRAQHTKFLDTLLVADHEYKHSLSPVYAVDEAKEATRDMLIFFTRKPVTEGHISAGIDSLKSHEKSPMEIPLFTLPN